MRKGIYKDNKRGTWYIQTKVKVNDELKTVTIRGYISKSDANADYDRALQEWVKAHTKHCKVVFFKDLIDEVRKDRATTVKLQTARVDENFCMDGFCGVQTMHIPLNTANALQSQTAKI